MRRAADVATELRHIAQFIHEPTEFHEATAEIGALPGSQVTVVAPTIEWQLNHHGLEEERPDPQLSLREPDDLIISEHAAVAIRLATLLKEPGWWRSLPTSFVAIGNLVARAT